MGLRNLKCDNREVAWSLGYHTWSHINVQTMYCMTIYLAMQNLQLVKHFLVSSPVTLEFHDESYLSLIILT